MSTCSYQFNNGWTDKVLARDTIPENIKNMITIARDQVANDEELRRDLYEFSLCFIWEDKGDDSTMYFHGIVDSQYDFREVKSGMQAALLRIGGFGHFVFYQPEY